MTDDPAMEVYDVTGMIDQLGAQTSAYQWLRELVLNAIEAEATHVEVDPFNDVLYDRYGVDKFVVANNGQGMKGDLLATYMKSLKKSSKSIGGAHEHQGLGARISTLTWNWAGVVVMSLQDDELNLVWLWRDPDLEQYRLREFEIGDELKTLITLSDYKELEIDEVIWEHVVPDFVRSAGHGVVVALLGRTREEPSFWGDPKTLGEGWKRANESDVDNKKWRNPRQAPGTQVAAVGDYMYRTGNPEWSYLNTRFWVLKHKTKIPGYGTWTAHDPTWSVNTINARGIKGAKMTTTKGGKPTSPSNNRQIKGGLREIFGHAPKVEHGVVELEHTGLSARVHWFLREKALQSGYGREDVEKGYVGALYQDELYEHHRRFKSWGIAYRDIQERLYLIVEPLAADVLVQDARGSRGVRPNMERSRLLWGPENSLDLPWDDWGTMFRDEHMPKPIRKAIDEYLAKQPAADTVDPDTLRKVMEYVGNTFETEDERVKRLKSSEDLYRGTLPPKKRKRGKTTKNPKLPVEVETGDGGSGTRERRPTRLDAQRKDENFTRGPLTKEAGLVPGVVVPIRGALPDVRWIAQAELVSALGVDKEREPWVNEVGVAWHNPAAATDHPRGLLQLAKDHWAVAAVLERFIGELPHVPEDEIVRIMQAEIAAMVLTRVLTIRKKRTDFADPGHVMAKMLGEMSLTPMLILSEAEYRRIEHSLKTRHGSAAKVKA